MSTSPPHTLYKFSSCDGAKCILKSRNIWTKSLLSFNDPFEVLPAFDEERKNEAIFSQKQYHRECGLPSGAGDLIKGGGEDKIPVEQWVDLAAHFHDSFFERVYSRFRVLCFSEVNDPILMWSHYANSHSGIALGFDVANGGFPLGKFPTGLPVDYIADRTSLKLPLDYYRCEGLARFDRHPPPAGFVRTASGIIISKVDEEARHLDNVQTLLCHKFDAWKYEVERRFLYDLDSPQNDGLQLSIPDKENIRHHVAQFSPESLKEVIFGYRCSSADIRALAPLLKLFPHLRFYYVDLHPMDFKVRIHDADLQDIFLYHQTREERSFRVSRRRSEY